MDPPRLRQRARWSFPLENVSLWRLARTGLRAGRFFLAIVYLGLMLSTVPALAEDGKPGAKGSQKAAKDAKDGADSPPAPPKVIRRDEIDWPSASGGDSADSTDLTATLGPDGRIEFQFRHQGWVDLIQWLSQLLDQPIDWQELPADSVNLISPSRMTADEAADLVNRHLLVRGFTMLPLEGGITVVATDKINPGMVRRVTAEQLTGIPDHTFVRVLMDAGWLPAEDLAKELQPMLSAAGKLTALATTNRIEAMDAAVNLRQVAKLLAEERDAASRDALAPEFRLRHIPAEEAKRLLEQFLGVEEKQSGPLSEQQMQMLQRMQQQNRGEQNKPAEPSTPEISIVANVRQNSVLIRAPMDRVAVAAEFLKRIDVPGGSLRSLADASSRVEVFRLVSLDPEKLLQIAGEMNVLEPTTRLRIDKENDAVIISGSAADRFIVRSLIERLDSGKRRFEVLQLRRLDANEVAESISFLMGTKEDEADSGYSRRSYYGYGRGNNDQDEEKDKFRVAANTRYRQVLLWANESEMAEVEALLIKLGELPPPGGSRRTMRVIEAAATPETLEYLQQLKQQWESTSGRQLLLPPESEFRDATRDRESPQDLEPQNDAGEPTADQEADGEESDRNGDDNSSAPKPVPVDTTDDSSELTRASNPASLSGRLVAIQSPLQNPDSSREVGGTASNQDAESESKPPTASESAIEIRLDPAGNLVLTGEDYKALDELENWMLQFAPPRRPYRVFHVRHASPTLVKLDLEDYFADEGDEKDSDDDSFYSWYFGRSSDEEEAPAGLGSSGTLKFVANSDTGTIVVSGASSEQLKTIDELIRLWDVPEPINPKRSRFTKLVPIRYGRATSIAATIKDAYRDLLSSNDKAFQAGRGTGRGNRDNSNRSMGSRLEDSESGQDGGAEDFSFNGKLSLGVDEVGNTLLVSAEGEPLLELIIAMIDKLDVAARPGGDIEIVQVSGNVSVDAIRQALAALGATGEESETIGRKASTDADSASAASRFRPDRTRGRRSQGTGNN